MSKHLINPENLANIICGDKEVKGAPFTVLSKKTGKDYTFQISRSKFNDHFYTHIKVEQGYMEFTRLGTYSSGIIKNRKAEIKTPAAIVASWLLKKIEDKKFSLLNDNIEIFHLGKCLRCGKILTDSTSIEHGLGPTCRNILN